MYDLVWKSLSLSKVPPGNGSQAEKLGIVGRHDQNADEVVRACLGNSSSRVAVGRLSLRYVECCHWYDKDSGLWSSGIIFMDLEYGYATPYWYSAIRIEDTWRRSLLATGCHT